jgi:UDP-3-O-[3-hydroxymyristoyl] glucosamine N-acyltransferase
MVAGRQVLGAEVAIGGLTELGASPSITRGSRCALHRGSGIGAADSIAVTHG